MFPELLKIGPVTVYTYGVTLVLAFVAAGWWVRYELARTGHDTRSIYNLVFAALLGGIIGARLFWVAAYWGDYAGALWRIFWLPEGGLVFQGGALGGALAVWAVAAYERLPKRALMDAVAPALALGAAIGRVGCFANGCCVGQVTSAWFGVSFFGLSQPRIPTQLLDMAYNLAIFVVLALLARRPHRGGDLLWLWLVLYGAGRFGVEFLRAAPAGVPAALAPLGLNPIVAFGLTLPQLYSLGMIAIGGAVILWERLRAVSPVAEETLADET